MLGGELSGMGVLVPKVPGIVSQRTPQKVQPHAHKAMGVREVPRAGVVDPGLPPDRRGAAPSEVCEEAPGMDTGPSSRTLAFWTAWRQDFKVQCVRDRDRRGTFFNL